MSADRDIEHLNSIVRLKIAPSPIHGVGVFATRPIQKGARLYAELAPFPYRLIPGNFSKLLPEVQASIAERWPRATQGSVFAYPDAIYQGYMNHSDSPNYDNQNDQALRDIEAGEEITEDYRLIEGWQEVFPFLTEKRA